MIVGVLFIGFGHFTRGGFVAGKRRVY